MARNTAQQGAGFERDVVHYLSGCQGREKPCTNTQHAAWTGFGYDCMRSAASKGAVDVVAVGPDPEGYDSYSGMQLNLLFIQCKITNPVIPPAERLRVQDLAMRAGALPLVAFKQVDQNNRRLRPHFRQLTGPGAGDWLLWEPGEDN